MAVRALQKDSRNYNDGEFVDSTDDCKLGSARTKILAYLGQLRVGEWVSARKLCFDLQLRYTTAKNSLAGLEDRDLVHKRISNLKGVVAEFQLNSSATVKVQNTRGEVVNVAYVPPDWSDAYGKHPHNL